MKKVLHMVLTPEAAGHQITDPKNRLAGNGPGGSRAGFSGLVAAMGRRGDYEVKAYSSYSKQLEEFEGVTFQRWDDLRDLSECDVLFAYYDVRPLMGRGSSMLRIGSHHTLHPYVAWPAIDVNTAPSQWAMDFLKRVFRPQSKWAVLPNAIEGLESVTYQPVPGRCIYQTSPDRGLHVLLELWPEIKRQVPHATLHVTGEPEAMIRSCTHETYRRADEERMAHRLADAIIGAQQAGGVTFLGRVKREQMIHELSEASCATYPFSVFCPCETFSVSVLEAMRVGIPVVMSPVDALGDLWGPSGCLMVGSPVDEHREKFVDAVCRVLTNGQLSDAVSGVQRWYTDQFTFDNAASALDEIIGRHIGIVTPEAA